MESLAKFYRLLFKAFRWHPWCLRIGRGRTTLLFHQKILVNNDGNLGLENLPSFSHGIFQTILFPIPVWSILIGKSPLS
jgi:hypothetical protein